MNRIAHLALEAPAATSQYHLEFLTATVLALICIAELLLHLYNTSATFIWRKVKTSFSVDHFFRTLKEVRFSPQVAATLAWVPFATTSVAKLSTTSTAFDELVFSQMEE